MSESKKKKMVIFQEANTDPRKGKVDPNPDATGLCCWCGKVFCWFDKIEIDGYCHVNYCSDKCFRRAVSWYGRLWTWLRDNTYCRLYRWYDNNLYQYLQRKNRLPCPFCGKKMTMIIEGLQMCMNCDEGMMHSYYKDETGRYKAEGLELPDL